MSTDYERDFAWQKQFEPGYLPIIGAHLLVPGSFQQDAKEATDFLLYRAIGHDVNTVAVRMRKPDVLSDRRWSYWQWEFTVRLWRASGVKTEHAKLVEGYADWMFYGVAHPGGPPGIKHWMIVNLRAWRNALATPEILRSLRTTDINNLDGRTGFRAYDIRSFPADPPILIDASFQWPPLPEAAPAPQPPAPLTPEQRERAMEISLLERWRALSKWYRERSNKKPQGEA